MYGCHCRRNSQAGACSPSAAVWSRNSKSGTCPAISWLYWYPRHQRGEMWETHRTPRLEWVFVISWSGIFQSSPDLKDRSRSSDWYRDWVWQRNIFCRKCFEGRFLCHLRLLWWEWQATKLLSQVRGQIRVHCSGIAWTEPCYACRAQLPRCHQCRETRKWSSLWFTHCAQLSMGRKLGPHGICDLQGKVFTPLACSLPSQRDLPMSQLLVPQSVLDASCAINMDAMSLSATWQFLSFVCSSFRKAPRWVCESDVVHGTYEKHYNHGLYR